MRAVLPAPARPTALLLKEHIALSPRAAHTRVVVSPLFTIVASLFEVVGGWRRGADDRWVEAVLRDAGDVDLAPFALFADDERIVPNLLIPVPPPGPVTWEQELDTLRHTPATAIVEELRTLRPGGSAALAAWERDPTGMHEAYLRSSDAWWRNAIAPQWPRMRALLETEVLRVARSLAVSGLGPTLAAIHPRLGWDGERLQIPGQEDDDTPDDPLGDRELVLLPIACGPDGILTGTDRPDVVSIAYAAPGTAALFGREPGHEDDPLAEALGTGRASVLRALDGPQPIRVLTHAVGLCPSTVHEHLAALRRADLVQRGRVGREVLYWRTPRGERLVELFLGDGPAGPPISLAAPAGR